MSGLGSDSRIIVRGIIWVFAFVFVGKLIGAGKEIIVASKFGINVEIDAYLFLLSLCVWPIGILFGVLTVVLVPLVRRAVEENVNSHELNQFLKELLGYIIVTSIILGLLGYIFIKCWLHSRFCDLPYSTIEIGERILPYLAPLLPLAMVISLFSAWMIAAGRHSNTLMEAIPALVIGLVLLPSRSTVVLLAAATLLGYMVHLAVLVLANRNGGCSLVPSLTRHSRYWSVFLRGAGLVLLGQIFIGTIPIVDQFFAAKIGGGNIATLSYATRIWGLLLGIGATAITRATLHVFAAVGTRNRSQATRTLARNWAIALFIGGTVLASAGWMGSTSIVRVLFERGEFGESETAAVATVLKWGLIQMPFYFSSLIWVSLISGQQRYSVLIFSGISGLAVKVAANYLFIGSLGASGIALSWTFVYAVNLTYLVYINRPTRAGADKLIAIP